MIKNKFEKHLIECQCTLSIFKNKNTLIYHKIPVVSFYDDNEDLMEKYIICDNCGVVHRVYEIFKSEIKWGMENLKSLVNNKEDIIQNFIFLGHEKIIELLEKEKAYLSDWEIAEYIIENEKSGTLVLHKKESDNNIIYTLLEISNGKYRTKKEITQRYL